MYDLIFHIPHSKTLIPDYHGYILKHINKEIKLLTDFNTDEIFDVRNTDKLVFPYSRIFCDVERFDDENEPMFQFGRGISYTKTDNGETLRKISNEDKIKIYNQYYLPHHQKLETLVENKLNNNKISIIIDCHSFSDIPFKSDIDQSTNRPDICIGTDEFHTPPELIDLIIEQCNTHHLTYQINSPYSGTIIPEKYYRKNQNVQGIMIEINRKLYMKKNIVNYNEIRKLNEFINQIFKKD